MGTSVDESNSPGKHCSSKFSSPSPHPNASPDKDCRSKLSSPSPTLHSENKLQEEGEANSVVASSWARVRQLMRKRSKDADSVVSRRPSVYNEDKRTGVIRPASLYIIQEKRSKSDGRKLSLHRSLSDSAYKLHKNTKDSAIHQHLESLMINSCDGGDNHLKKIMKTNDLLGDEKGIKSSIMMPLNRFSTIETKNKSNDKNQEKNSVKLALVKNDNAHESIRINRENDKKCDKNNLKTNSKCDDFDGNIIISEQDRNRYSIIDNNCVRCKSAICEKNGDNNQQCQNKNRPFPLDVEDQSLNFNSPTDCTTKAKSKLQEDEQSDFSDDSVFEEDDSDKMDIHSNTCEGLLDGRYPLLKPLGFRCRTLPQKVYPDLINTFSLATYQNEQLDRNAAEKFDVIEEEAVDTMDDDEEGYVAAMPNIKPHRMHYLENVVYMSPKRNLRGDRTASLPTSTAVVDINELTRLQGMHEKAKGKKASGGNRGSIGKSVFNRLTKKLTPVSTINEPDPDCRNMSPSGAASGMGSLSSSKRSSRKKFDRRGSASIGNNSEGKSKSFRMGQKFRRTFSSGNDNLLQQAVLNKDLEMLEKLLVHERYLQEINYLEPPGVTVFHQACVFGDFHVVQFLINKGADVALLTWTKLSPLKIAVMFGHYEVAELLLDSGADRSDIINGFQDYMVT